LSKQSSKSAPQSGLKEQTAGGRDIVNEILDAAWKKNAFDAVRLDVRKVVDYTESILILSGRSTTHVLAIADHIEESLGKIGAKPLGVEGRPFGNWILIDLNECIVHIFHRPVREFYQIDKLFADAEFTVPEEPDWVKEFRKQSGEDF